MEKIYMCSSRLVLVLFILLSTTVLQPVCVFAGDPGTTVDSGKQQPGNGNQPEQQNIYQKQVFDKPYYERWEINSARTTEGGELDPQFMLSPKSFFNFIDHERVEFRLNEFYPVQKGKYKQNQVQMDIYVTPDPNCEKCFTHFSISRNSMEDKELLLEFDGHQQMFTVNQIR